MSQNQIVVKLEEEFRRELDSETQVVYVLVEVGKLLEHGQLKDRYKTINFYRNWAVHTEISGSAFADELVRAFDQYIIDNNVDYSKTLKDFVSPLTLRDELKDYLKDTHGLSFPCCENGVKWKRFVKHFAGVISETPLLCSGRKKTPMPTQYVESITVSRSRNQEKRAMLTWAAKCHTSPPDGVKTTLPVVLLEDVDVIMFEHVPKPSGTAS
jgi:hypothetical protein